MSNEIFKCIDCCVVQWQLLEIMCIVVNCAKIKNVTSLFQNLNYCLYGNEWPSLVNRTAIRDGSSVKKYADQRTNPDRSRQPCPATVSWV